MSSSSDVAHVGSTMTGDGAQIRYACAGEGPPVLMIQGTGIAGCAWRPQIEGLKHRHRLISFDNRGVGESTLGSDPLSVERMADDAIAVMDAVGVDRAHVAGHSLGGLIALALAMAHPDRVDNLALLCTFADGAPVAAPRPWIVWIGLRARIGTRSMRRRAFIDMITPASTRSSVDCDALAVEFGDVFGRDLADSPPIAMAQVKAFSRCNLGRRLHELDGIPTLVVSGDEDRIAPPKFGRAIAAGIPNARYHELRAAAHALTIQRADEINTLLADHFAASTPHAHGRQPLQQLGVPQNEPTDP